MMKPTNIDAQRVLAIMGELKEKLTFLSVVTPEVLEGIHGSAEESDKVDKDFIRKAEDQCDLEDAYVMSITGNYAVVCFCCASYLVGVTDDCFGK